MHCSITSLLSSGERKQGHHSNPHTVRAVCPAVVGGLLIVSGASAQVLVKQPTDVTDVRSISYVNASPPRGTVGVTLWGSHSQLRPTDRTGPSGTTPGSRRRLPDAITSLRRPDVARSHGHQAYGGEIGINIHSASIATNWSAGSTSAPSSGRQPATPAQPFASGKKAKYSFAAKIPRSRQTDRGVSQVVAYYNLRDRVHKREFWFGMVLFDSRGWSYQRNQGLEHAMSDQGTNSRSSTQRPRTRNAAGSPIPDSCIWRAAIRGHALLRFRDRRTAGEGGDYPDEGEISGTRGKVSNDPRTTDPSHQSEPGDHAPRVRSPRSACPWSIGSWNDCLHPTSPCRPWCWCSRPWSGGPRLTISSRALVEAIWPPPSATSSDRTEGLCARATLVDPLQQQLPTPVPCLADRR